MLPTELHNIAIVILSTSNNPRLLNGDFLKRNGVVKEDWAVADTLVTPPVARVTFENSLQVLVEENRLHFAVNRPNQFPWAEELPRVAIAYTQLLPHVNYRGVGLNYGYACKAPCSGETPVGLVKGLLAQGPWLDCCNGISDAAIEFQYRNEKPYMKIKIMVKQDSDPHGKKLQSLIFNVNMHHDFLPEQTREREAYISGIGERQAAFFDFLEKLPY